MLGQTTVVARERKLVGEPMAPVHSGGGRRRRAVVIGSGFGGLALAIRLQARGYAVTLVEKRAKVGGRAYQWREGGYTFDMGPSLVTAPQILESIFEAAGRRLEDYVELMPLDPYYRIYFHDGTRIDYSGDAERMKAQMRQFNPADAERYDAFMARIEPIYEAVIQEGLGARPFDSLGRMAGFVPRAIRLGALRPVASVVARYFEDFRHHFMFSFHPLFIGGNPFSAPSVYLSIPFLEKADGVWFAKGGMYAIVEALATVFRELGGEIETDCEATRILVRDGRAAGVEAGDRLFPADLVVSNGDVGHTYKYLVDARHRRKWTDRRVERTDYTMSCYLLYLGVRKTFPGLEHHTLILSERYRDLLRDIFDRKIVPDDFSMYLHAPTKSDPAMAPDGCESMYVLVPVANQQGTRIDWEAIGEAYGDRIIDFLEDFGLDGLREHIEVRRQFTPDDFASELNAMYGNAFAVVPKLTQTAWFRPHNRSEDVPGLYFVGAGTHPGAGVPGVMLSAEATLSCILEDDARLGKTAAAG